MDKKEGDNTKRSSRVKKKEANEKILSRKLLLEAIVKKIDYYTTKTTVTDFDLYYLMKEFFKDFLELKYEFSFDELLVEFDKIYLETKQREDLVRFINKVKIIEYQNEPFKEAKIKEFIKEFSEISKKLIKMSGPPKQGFWSKIKKLFVKEEHEVYDNYETAAQANAPEQKKSESKSTSASSGTSNLETVTETEFSNSDSKIGQEPSDEELNKYKSGDSLSSQNYASSNSQTLSVPTDLASIEAHNRMVMGKSEESSAESSVGNTENMGNAVNAKDKKKKKKKDKKSKKNKSSKPQKKENKKEEDKKNDQMTDDLKKTEEANYSWSSEDAKTASNQTETKKMEPQETPAQENIPAAQTGEQEEEKKSESSENKSQTKKESKTKTNKKQKTEKKENKKQQKQVKLKPAKKENKNENKQDKNKKEVKKTNKVPAKNKPDNDNIDSLIAKAKKIVKKAELMDLYKKINSIYEKGDVKFQAKYYKEVMGIYKRLAKLK